MRTLVLALASLAFVHVASAQQGPWRAGQGIANDYAVGTNARDVTFVPRDANTGYGYRQYTLPIGLTILPWSVPNFECFVAGVRFNFGWGKYAETYGIDWGAFSQSGAFGGIAANLFGNYASANAAGVIVGFVNIGEADVCGLQVGAVNVAGNLRGVQIGFLNFNRAGIVFPLVNAGF